MEMNREQRYDKFRTSLQAKVKLEIALEDFFTPGLPDVCRNAYGAYLRQRIRPAVELLIEQEDTEKLEALDRLGMLPTNLVDGFLQTAVNRRKNAAMVWLLRKKQDCLGFAPRDFSL